MNLLLKSVIVLVVIIIVAPAPAPAHLLPMHIPESNWHESNELILIIINPHPERATPTTIARWSGDQANIHCYLLKKNKKQKKKIRTQPNKQLINVHTSMLYIDYLLLLTICDVGFVIHMLTYWIHVSIISWYLTLFPSASSNDLEDEELSDIILSKATSPNAGRMLFWWKRISRIFPSQTKL